MNNHDDNVRFYSVKEVCEAVCLSKSRFYQLLGTTFPWPAYLITNRRPVFTEGQFQRCLEVRRANQGINGKPVMFYSKRRQRGPRKATTRKPSQKTARPMKHARALDALTQLGLTGITEKDIDRALKVMFLPSVSSDKGEVIARLFRHLKARDRQDSTG